MRGLVLVYVSSRKLNIVQHEGWVRIGFGLSWAGCWWWGVAWGINVSCACRINVNVNINVYLGINHVNRYGPVVQTRSRGPPSRIPSWQVRYGWGLRVPGRGFSRLSAIRSQEIAQNRALNSPMRRHMGTSSTTKGHSSPTHCLNTVSSPAVSPGGRKAALHGTNVFGFFSF